MWALLLEWRMAIGEPVGEDILQKSADVYEDRSRDTCLAIFVICQVNHFRN